MFIPPILNNRLSSGLKIPHSEISSEGYCLDVGKMSAAADAAGQLNAKSIAIVRINEIIFLYGIM